MDITLLLIFVTLLLSAFFSGVEIAFFSVNKLAMELVGKEDSRTGRILAHFSKNSSNFIGTLLIGNNISLVLFGVLTTALMEPYLMAISSNELVILLLQTVVTTIVVLLIGEFLPKTLFQLKPLGILSFFAIPLRLIYWLLFLPVQFVVVLSNFVLKKGLRLDFEDATQPFNKTDLQHFIELNNPESDNDEEDGEIDTELFENALYLTQVKTRECMVPRPEMAAVGINATVEELRNTFIETGFSRLPVYFESLNNILGYVHHFDLLTMPKNIGSIIMKIPVVPETMTAKDLLNLFRKERKSIAWVVDEFGGTAGIVTMEDILEELFGEIQDEHDDEDHIEKQLADNEYIFSGRLEIDYLNEKYDIGLPESEEYETLAGFVVTQHESIPEMNEKIELGRFQFDILYVSNTRIETLKIKIEQEKST